MTELTRKEIYVLALEPGGFSLIDTTYDTHKEASEAGRKKLQEHNAWLEQDEETRDEAIDLWEFEPNLTSHDLGSEPVTKFYVKCMHVPYPPTHMGDNVIDAMACSDGWDDYVHEIGSIYDRIGEDKVKELDQLIYEWLFRETENVGYYQAKYTCECQVGEVANEL